MHGVNLAHNHNKFKPHGYDYRPRRMEKKRAQRKNRMQKKFSLMHTKSNKDTDEEEFQKKVHADVENGIEQ